MRLHAADGRCGLRLGELDKHVWAELVRGKIVGEQTTNVSVEMISQDGQRRIDQIEHLEFLPGGIGTTRLTDLANQCNVASDEHVGHLVEHGLWIRLHLGGKLRVRCHLDLGEKQIDIVVEGDQHGHVVRTLDIAGDRRRLELHTNHADASEQAVEVDQDDGKVGQRNIDTDELVLINGSTVLHSKRRNRFVGRRVHLVLGHVVLPTQFAQILVGVDVVLIQNHEDLVEHTSRLRAVVLELDQQLILFDALQDPPSTVGQLARQIIQKRQRVAAVGRTGQTKDVDSRVDRRFGNIDRSVDG